MTTKKSIPCGNDNKKSKGDANKKARILNVDASLFG